MIESIDVSTIYEVPIKMEEEKLDEIVLEKLSWKMKVRLQAYAADYE